LDTGGLDTLGLRFWIHFGYDGANLLGNAKILGKENFVPRTNVMASISKIRGKFWAVKFRVAGVQYGQFSLKVEDEQLALDAKLAIERRVFQVENNLIQLPPNTDIGKFCLNGEHSIALQQPLSSLIEDYIKHRTLRCNAGQLSYGSLASDKSRLSNFTSFLEDTNQENATISPVLLRSYQTYILGLLAEKKIGDYDAFHKLRTLKAFVLWLYNEEIIPELPRMLKSYAEVKLPKPVPTFFTIPQIHTLLTNSNPFQTLIILLGLNCGYTSADISSLTPAMVDWDKGIIDRRRNKTGIRQRHLLWKPTLDLLNKLGDKTKPYLLYRPDGNPIKLDNSLSCYVKNQFLSLITRLKKSLRSIENENVWVEQASHKLFRKTSSNLLAEQYIDSPHLLDLFLAHGERGKHTSHYVDKHYRLLDEGILWLYEKLDLSKIFGTEAEQTS
jgi:integrase